jgi:hypothetical protein
MDVEFPRFQTVSDPSVADIPRPKVMKSHNPPTVDEGALS